jgi:adenylosuccinate synthase
MPSLVIIGAQWGDEGKGKIVDYLTASTDWVVRFHGGNNAGHTLVVNGKKTKLSLVPSGILRAHPRCAIGAGVVLDPRVFVQEVAGLRESGVDVSPRRLVIDQDVHLILDYHIAIDKAREEAKGKDKIGTTGRGIGPCYEDRAARIGVRVADLLDREALTGRLTKIVEERNLYLREVLKSSTQVELGNVLETVALAAEQILPFIGNVSTALYDALKRSERVVFEGAQGTLLDTTFGTVPFVTSSSTLSGAVTTGCGVGPKSIDYVLGVAKAYCTRVGSGPFPTELHDTTGDQVRERGGEFGTVTGRPRRCGWFDAVALRRAVRLNGVDSLVLTKLDVLSGFDKIKVCVKYILDGKEIDDLPPLAADCERVVPKYVELDGWKENLQGITKWHHLPGTARLYVSALAEMVGVPVSVVSVAPERESTFFSSSATFLENFLAER